VLIHDRNRRIAHICGLSRGSHSQAREMTIITIEPIPCPPGLTPAPGNGPSFSTCVQHSIEHIRNQGDE
jgi:hypothetical protein